MKRLFLLLFYFSFLSCDTNEKNTVLINSEKSRFIGIWKEVSQKRIKGDPKVDSDYEKQFNNPDELLIKSLYETYFVIKQNKSGLNIISDVTDQNEPDKCDSIIINGDKISFRKINQNNTYNYFTLQLNGPKILSGEMVSYNGNTYEVLYEKMLPEFQIKHTEPTAL